MIIFIDESGDSGFKISMGSSPYFVIVLVIIDDELEAENIAVIVNEFKRKLGKPISYELKFNKLKKSDKITFLKDIKGCKFRVRAIIVIKNNVYTASLRKDTRSFYNFFLRQLLEHNNATIENAKIRLDGFGERRFKSAMTSYLRKRLNSGISVRVMSNLKFVDSKYNPLIQLADMVAGSIHRSYQIDKNDCKVYKNIIMKKIEEEWVFE